MDRIRRHKQRQVDQVENVYRSEYDLRSSDFSCTGDDMEGELYMIDKVKDPDMEQIKEYKQNYNKQGLEQELKFDKVTINMNYQKFSISDRDSILKEIIYLDSVYPREKEL